VGWDDEVLPPVEEVEEPNDEEDEDIAGGGCEDSGEG